MRPAFLAFAVVALGSCRSPTEIRFEVTTDVPCSDVRGVEVQVGSVADYQGRPPSSAGTCKDGRIGALVVVPSGSKSDVVAVQFVLGRGTDPSDCAATGYADCIVARRSLRFMEHEPLLVQVPLRNACRGLPCPAHQTCVKGTCVDASLSESAACSGPGCGEDALSKGDAGTDAATDAATDGAPDGGAAKHVFVTSTQYSGALGGLAGADAKCQARAVAGGLSGTYKAWLADSKQRVSNRFSAAGLAGPWVLPDGTKVADDFTQLTKGTLFHAIDMTELRGAPPTTTAKCSGRTTSTWSEGDREPPLSQCLDWTGTPATGESQYGIPTATKGWQADPCGAFGAQCLKTAALFCFEQ